MFHSLLTSLAGVCFLAVTCLISVFIAAEIHANDDPKPAATDEGVEKGTVHWVAGLEAAKKISKDTKRPLFVLFQEIPG